MGWFFLSSFSLTADWNVRLFISEDDCFRRWLAERVFCSYFDNRLIFLLCIYGDVSIFPVLASKNEKRISFFCGEILFEISFLLFCGVEHVVLTYSNSKQLSYGSVQGIIKVEGLLVLVNLFVYFYVSELVAILPNKSVFSIFWIIILSRCALVFSTL